MLFDFKERFKQKKMSKHLIGIDAELYILYEDKVLFRTSGKIVGKCFCLGFPFYQ